MKYRNIQIDKFLSSSALATSLFITSGCHKTYKDYKNAPKEYKDKLLVKDCLVLSGAALGMFAYQSGSSKLLKSKKCTQVFEKISEKFNQTEIKQDVRTSIQYTAEILKELTSGVISSAMGILGALGADYLYTKTNPKELEYNIVPEETSRMSKFLDKSLSKVADKDTRNALYTSISDIPVISSGMLGANAIDISKNKEFRKKLEHTTGYLINDTLVPLIFLSVSSALTGKMKPKFRIPTVFASLFLGTLGLRKCMDKYVELKKTI